MTPGRALPLSVLTWNLYLGAELTPLVTASPNQMPRMVTEIFRQVLKTNFPVRVKEMVRQVALKRPDFVGLQEVETWSWTSPEARTRKYDFLHLLLHELSNRGLHYKVAASNTNFSSRLPDSYGNFIQFVDRDVILVREQEHVRVLQTKQRNFQTKLMVMLAGQPLDLLRGWSSVDVWSHGRTFRMLNTHLEFADHAIRDAQAKELLAGPANTNLPVIVAGDLNSTRNERATQVFIDAGFRDLWSEVRHEPGYTCCQNADLSNEVSRLNSRIDYILFKNALEPRTVQLVGDKRFDNGVKYQWPSDHAGVFGAFVLRD